MGGFPWNEDWKRTRKKHAPEINCWKQIIKIKKLKWKLNVETNRKRQLFGWFLLKRVGYTIYSFGTDIQATGR